jgi:hypothetical protein
MDKCLETSHYTHAFIFDNLGNYMCHGNIHMVKDTHSYLKIIEDGRSSKTFYCIYILLLKNAKVDGCAAMCPKYMNKYDSFRMQLMLIFL